MKINYSYSIVEAAKVLGQYHKNETFDSNTEVSVSIEAPALVGNTFDVPQLFKMIRTAKLSNKIEAIKGVRDMVQVASTGPARDCVHLGGQITARCLGLWGDQAPTWAQRVNFAP